MGLLWGEVYDVMSGSAESIVSFITNNDPQWWDNSPMATQKEFEDSYFKAELWKRYSEDLDKIQQGIADVATVAALTQGNGTDTGSNASVENMEGTGTGTNPETTTPSGSPSGGDTYDAKVGLKGADKTTKYKVAAKYADDNQDHYFRTKAEAKAFIKSQSKLNTKKKKEEAKKSLTAENGGKGKYNIYAKAVKSGGKTLVLSGYFTKALAEAAMDDAKNDAKYKDKYKKWKVATKKPSGYATGGYDYETGLAMLHGTANKPEAILNATQTQILRDNILSNKPDSLVSLLKAYNEAYKDNISMINNNDAGIVIENATVNMNVSQIANDYDAQRAGEQALEKMLEIARKTSAKNSIRR